VEVILSLCPLSREFGRSADPASETKRKTTAEEVSEADSGDAGWTYRSTLDGKGTIALPFTVILV
jgi:hypothetical protein